jgi:hypothetical protein
MAAIVQYFRRGEGIKQIAGNFNAVGRSLEVIINDDSMSEGAAWIDALQVCPETLTRTQILKS